MGERIEIPPPGTRGVFFPRLPSWLLTRMNRLQARRFRSRPGEKTPLGLPGLLLETIGAHSGEPRTALLGFLSDGPDAWLVIASLAGTARHPAWLYNLRAQPNAVIDLGRGERIPVRAEMVAGEALDAAWRRLASEGPPYLGYRTNTDRTMPILRLRRRPAAADAEP